MGIDPHIWGPSAWYLFHIMTYFCPPDTSGNANTLLLYRQQYKTFFENLQNIVPCEICSQNYGYEYPKFPITSYLNSRDNIVNWLMQFHNNVNKRTNHLVFTRSMCDNLYSVANTNPDVIDYKKIFFFCDLIIDHAAMRLSAVQLRAYRTFFTIFGEIMSNGTTFGKLFKNILRKYPMNKYCVGGQQLKTWYAKYKQQWQVPVVAMANYNYNDFVRPYIIGQIVANNANNTNNSVKLVKVIGGNVDNNSNNSNKSMIKPVGLSVHKVTNNNNSNNNSNNIQWRFTIS